MCGSLSIHILAHHHHPCLGCSCAESTKINLNNFTVVFGIAQQKAINFKRLLCYGKESSWYHLSLYLALMFIAIEAHASGMNLNREESKRELVLNANRQPSWISQHSPSSPAHSAGWYVFILKLNSFVLHFLAFSLLSWLLVSIVSFSQHKSRRFACKRELSRRTFIICWYSYRINLTWRSSGLM